MSEPRSRLEMPVARQVRYDDGDAPALSLAADCGVSVCLSYFLRSSHHDELCLLGKWQ